MSCALCTGAHGPAYPLAVDAVDPRGERLAESTPLCLHCTCLVRDADHVGELRNSTISHAASAAPEGT